MRTQTVARWQNSLVPHEQGITTLQSRHTQKIGCAVKHKPHRATGQNCREENAPHEATHRPYVVAVTNDVPQEATDQPYVIAPQGQDQSK